MFYQTNSFRDLLINNDKRNFWYFRKTFDLQSVKYNTFINTDKKKGSKNTNIFVNIQRFIKIRKSIIKKNHRLEW